MCKYCNFKMNTRWARASTAPTMRTQMRKQDCIFIIVMQIVPIIFLENIITMAYRKQVGRMKFSIVPSVVASSKEI